MGVWEDIHPKRTKGSIGVQPQSNFSLFESPVGKLITRLHESRLDLHHGTTAGLRVYSTLRKFRKFLVT